MCRETVIPWAAVRSAEVPARRVSTGTPSCVAGASLPLSVGAQIYTLSHQITTSTLTFSFKIGCYRAKGEENASARVYCGQTRAKMSVLRRRCGARDARLAYIHGLGLDHRTSTAISLCAALRAGPSACLITGWMEGLVGETLKITPNIFRLEPG